MTRSLFSARPPLWVWFAAVMLFVMAVFGLGGFVMAQSGHEIGSDDRLVTIYENGTEKTIVTKATTVAGALEQAGVEVEQIDTVEPSADTKLVASSYSVNIYRARPVVVVDGAQKIRVMTAAQSSGKIAEAAGVTLYPEDKTSISRVDDVLANGGAGLTMTIDRATPVNLVLYGQKNLIHTQSKTVGQLLDEKKIKLAANDTLSVDRSAAITPNLTIEIWRNGTQTVTQEEEIPFTTEQIKDADREVGYKEVKEVGENGKKSVTYEIEMRNGQEVSRKEIQSVTTKEPKKQVEVVGTKVSLPAGSHEDWMAAAGISPSDYGYVNYIVGHESGWNPNAVNAYSGACGLGQQLPCGKWAGAWNDPIAALRAMSSYVCQAKFARYGSSSCWENAYRYWQDHGNY